MPWSKLLPRSILLALALTLLIRPAAAGDPLPSWNDGAAKAKLLQMFEAVGLEDPWVSAQRRRLSLLLFG